MADISGNGGNNLLSGTSRADRIVGLGGDDRLFGGRGSDNLGGGLGTDILRGGDGSDSLFGGDGDDRIFGHGAGGADPASGQIDAIRVAAGLTQPVFAAAAPGDPGRLYIAELRTGIIKILDLDTRAISATPFLDIPDARIGMEGEWGFLGFAFHPDYETNRQVFISLVSPAGNTEILRFTTFANDPNRLNPASETTVLTFPRNPPATNHAAGWIGFGPDGYLYIASGDGGPGGDPENAAQNTNTLLGKILRIDVDGDDFPGNADRNYAVPADNPFASGGGAPEIWAYGLRNPWRPSFDSRTGDLYIADVGQNAFEEVNWQPASSRGGENYGWSVMEGRSVFNDTRPGNPSPGDPILVDPVHVYAHQADNASITGGYVYHGPLAGLEGFYLYADFASRRIATFRIQDGAATDFTNLVDRVVTNIGSLGPIASFAVDAAENLYVIALSGQIYRLDPSAGAADGSDLIRAGDGNDSAFGGAGLDRLFGDAGDDMLSGGLGSDRLSGGIGADWLRGDGGGDSLQGDQGNDVLLGGEGADVLVGGGGTDDVVGGLGIDQLVFAPGGGTDVFRDFTNAVDRVDLSAFAFATTGEAMSHARNLANGNVIFRFDGGEVLIVADTTVAQLTSQVFV